MPAPSLGVRWPLRPGLPDGPTLGVQGGRSVPGLGESLLRCCRGRAPTFPHRCAILIAGLGADPGVPLVDLRCVSR